LLTIYLKQADTYQDLTKSAPNIYQWVFGDVYTIAVPLGLGFTAVVISLFIARVYRSPVQLNPDLILQIALLSCLLMPYCLPKMHERYFYPADVISLIFCFYFPKQWYVPILISYSSLFSYMIFLLDKRMVSMQVLSLIMTGLIIGLLRQFDRSL
jgi:Gpi18-like mannosyltransferase